ncbi:MAG: hypothetical protein P1V36_13305 [Planctomycetota bacterium]|nr:hypothetical protein [Planctomycetota bacterium]
MKEGYFADVARCFRGPSAWVSWVVVVYGFAAGFLIVYLAIGLFDAETTRDQILYATGLILSAVVMMTTKLYFFMQMSRRWLAERLDEDDRAGET